MKNLNTLIASILIASLLAGVFLIQSCQKSTDYDPDFLYIENLDKTYYSPEELRILKEADKRMSRHIVLGDGRLTMGNTTAQDLKIDQRLFNKFLGALDLYSDLPDDIKSNIVLSLKMTKSGDEESGGLDDIIRQLLATATSTAIQACGFSTKSGYWNMYVSGRTSTYQMTSSQWSDVSSYAKQCVGNNYFNNSFVYGGVTYYRNSVSFYGANGDLRYSYGVAVVVFNAYGEPVGFYDRYDFNEGVDGQRTPLNEALTNWGNYCGNGSDGFPITYGIPIPAGSQY